METLSKIETLTKTYSDAREALAGKVRGLEAKINAEKELKLPAIKAALAKTKEAEARLKAAIDAHPELFAKPRTQIFHGVKVGYMKSKGSITWEDADTVVKLIGKHFGERIDELTRKKVVPDKDALSKLAAVELKKLGVSVTNDTDAIVVKPVDGEVDKIVNALLKDESGEKAA